MSKNTSTTSIVQCNTSKLVWLIQRPDEAMHSEAVTEARRRVVEGCKPKNMRALEAALRAYAVGAPVPARSTTIRRTQPVYAQRVEFTPNPDAEKALEAGAQWADDGAIVPA